MNEQDRIALLRDALEELCSGHSIGGAKQARAALAATAAPAEPPKPVAGWLEAAIAWEVCASIHEKYAKGKDALYSTRHADFVKHAVDCRSNALAAPQQERWARWVETRVVSMPDHVHMSAAYDFDGWECSRLEMHTPHGSFAVWPDQLVGSKSWSMCGGPSHIAKIGHYSTLEAARLDAEMCVESLVSAAPKKGADNMTTTPTSAELLPCPFCSFNYSHCTRIEDEKYFIECLDCGASGPVAMNKAKALAAWQARTALAQPVPAADVPTPGPWHDWAGGECPVAGDVWVDVTLRDGEDNSGRAKFFHWDHMQYEGDIIAWRYAAVTPVPAIQVQREPKHRPHDMSEAKRLICQLEGALADCRALQQSNALPKEQPALTDEQICELAFRNMQCFETEEILAFARAVLLAAQRGKL